MPVYDGFGKWVCESCNDYARENKRSVNMHEIACKKKKDLEELEKLKEKVEQKEPEAQVEQRQREKPDRAERIPMGTPQRKITLPPGAHSDDGFVYRVFNDNWRKEPMRIQRAKQAGYEIVEGWEPAPMGSNDDGSPIMGVMMRIPKEWYDQDQRVKQKEVDRIDEAIKGGKLEQETGDGRYIPSTGIKIRDSHSENP